MVDWLFRNRRTGEITIAQFPNAPLVVFGVAWLARRLLHPTGALDPILAVVATGALVVWALDELIRGVNPWRRFLGGVVLGVTVVALVA
ncbi:MAG TPA: hypothetical protein VF320_06330 [Acidimicrobiales bacterium]